MTNTVKELEEQLQEARLREAWDKLQNKFKEIESKYKGKAFGSSALRYDNLSKYKNNIYIQILYVSDVYICDRFTSESNISLITTFEEYKIYKDSAALCITGESMNISKYNDGLSLNKNKCWRSFDNYDISGYNHEIKLETYENLKKLVGGAVDNVFTLSHKHIGFNKPEKSSSEDILRKYGAKLIKLTDSELYTLVSENNPFVYGNSLLVNDISISILENLRKKYRDLDSKDNNFYLYGEYIRRSGFYERKLKDIENILKKVS